MHSNKIFTIFALISIVMLSSCQKNKDVQVCSLFANFVFDHILEQETNTYKAALLFNSNYLSHGFNKVIIPHDVVAGDELYFTYNGQLVCTDSYPGTLFILEGELLDYQIKKTNIKSFEILDSQASINILKSEYQLKNEYVIINENNEYMSLDEYQGDILYLSIDRSYLNVYENDLQPIYVAGIYAYNPRINQM